MNKEQKIIILVAIFVVAVMILYPPWVLFARITSTTQTTLSGSYSFIWSPPEYARFIDQYRLGFQLFGVLVIATGLCFVCSTTKKKRDPK